MCWLAKLQREFGWWNFSENIIVDKIHPHKYILQTSDWPPSAAFYVIVVEPKSNIETICCKNCH